MNEAARLVSEITGLGYSRKFVAEALGTNSSYVSQFFSKGKGASKVDALRAILGRVRAQEPAAPRSAAGKAQRQAAAAAATPLNPRRQQAVRGRSGYRSKSGRIAQQRAGRQAIASGAKKVEQLVRDADAAGRRIYLTVSVPKSTNVHKDPYDPTQGRWAKSKGGRRYSREKELDLGGGGRGFDPATLVDLTAQYGSLPAAVSQWLVLQGWTDDPPAILRIEVRQS